MSRAAVRGADFSCSAERIAPFVILQQPILLNKNWGFVGVLFVSVNFEVIYTV